MNANPRRLDPIRRAAEKQWARPDVGSVLIDLPLPISTNALRAVSFGRFCNTERYRSWKVVAGTELNCQRPGRVFGPYSIVVKINRRRTNIDLDNSIKCLQDLLQTHRVIDNDRQAERITIEWSDVVEGSSVLIERWTAA